MACSSKKKTVMPSSRVANQTVVSNQKFVEQGLESDKPGVPQNLTKYFSQLQILTETTPEGSCADDMKITTQSLEPFKAHLSSEKEIQMVQGADFKFFIVNAKLEVIGFDSAKYAFTAIDGKVPDQIPFGIKLRRTPGHVLEIQFLDQIVQMKLLTTPIYMFSAIERRGSCTVKHNVNVFTEQVGYYKKSETPFDSSAAATVTD